MDNEQLLLALSEMMDKKLEPVNGRLDSMGQRLDSMDQRLDKVEQRLDKVDQRLDKVESEISALKAGQTDLRNEIKQVDIKVSKTYQIALDAWGVSAENRHWLENGKVPV